MTGYIQTNLSFTYLNSGQIEAAQTANNETRAVWQALGNLPMMADSYTMKLYMYRNFGKYDELLAAGPEAVRFCQSVNNKLHETMALLNIGEAHCLQGRIGQAVANIEAAMTVTEEFGESWGIYTYYPSFILICLLSGALEKAEEWADKLVAFREAFVPIFQIFFLVDIARAKIARGKLGEGKAILEQAFVDFDEEGSSSLAMSPLFVADGHLQLALGNPERTHERMAEVIQQLHQIGSRFCLAEAYWLQGKAWLALEKMAQAKEALMAAKAAAEAN